MTFETGAQYCVSD